MYGGNNLLLNRPLVKNSILLTFDFFLLLHDFRKAAVKAADVP